MSWIPRAWVLDRCGTPWLVVLPEAGTRHAVQRALLYEFPDWEPEPQVVARFVRYVAGVGGADRPSADDALSLGEYVRLLMRQVLLTD